MFSGVLGKAGLRVFASQHIDGCGFGVLDCKVSSAAEIGGVIGVLIRQAMQRGRDERLKRCCNTAKWPKVYRDIHGSQSLVQPSINDADHETTCVTIALTLQQLWYSRIDGIGSKQQRMNWTDMKIVLTALSLIFAPALATANDVIGQWNADRTQIFNAEDVNLDDLKWIARPIVVFAQTPNDPAFQRQIELLTEEWPELVERDVIVIIDTEPDAPTSARLQLRPRGFMFVLIGKDGQIKQRKPTPWNVRELSRTIDKMPMRQQEIRDRRLGN